MQRISEAVENCLKIREGSNLNAAERTVANKPWDLIHIWDIKRKNDCLRLCFSLEILIIHLCQFSYLTSLTTGIELVGYS